MQAEQGEARGGGDLCAHAADHDVEGVVAVRCDLSCRHECATNGLLEQREEVASDEEKCDGARSQERECAAVDCDDT